MIDLKLRKRLSIIIFRKNIPTLNKLFVLCAGLGVMSYITSHPRYGSRGFVIDLEFNLIHKFNLIMCE